MISSLAPTILVPGAAGAAAIGAIRWLRKSGFKGRIVATDGEPLAAGFAFSDVGYTIPDLTDSTSLSRALEIIATEKVQVILPSSPTDCAVYSEHKQALAALGTVLVASDGAVVRLCQDKCAFHSAVADDFPVPDMISIENEEPSRYPCFVKPRWGSGSRGCGLCVDSHDWHFYRKFPGPLMAQEVIGGSEYSVDVLSDLGGEPRAAVVRERIAISDGISTRVRVIRDEEIESLCLRMARWLGLKGVSCMQLKRDHVRGLRFLEVNAHLGATSIATILSGVDVVRFLLSMAFGETFTIPTFKELTIVRHFDEIVVGSN